MPTVSQGRAALGFVDDCRAVVTHEVPTLRRCRKFVDATVRWSADPIRTLTTS